MASPAGLISRTRLLLAVLACAAASCALLPSAAGAAEQGVVIGGATTDAATYQRIAASGARHVRIFMSWRALEQQPGAIVDYQLRGFDDTVNRIRGMGKSVYFVVVETPAWAGAHDSPPPVGPYADFMRRIAAHFRGRVQGYEVWNEPDDPISAFWRGGASPATYAALLRASYAAVKSADPGARVGIGALLGNNYQYVEGLYAAGARGSFDFVGLHTDQDCIKTDPRQAIRELDGRISRWSFTGYREVRQVMLDHGDDKPIWMTEIGWSVTSARCPSRASEVAGVSPTQQAEFLTAAYACLAADPYVEKASWFSLSDFGAQETVGFRYGLWSWGGAARPAASAFQRVGSLGPDRSCGLQVDRNGSGIELQYPREGQNVSADLRYRALAHEPVATLAVFVDGRQIRVTSRQVISGVWTAWRRLRYGPHNVTVRVKDRAQNVTIQSVTVNRVPYGLGESIRTRASVGVYGRGRKRQLVARLFTLPAVAKPFVRGALRLHIERKAGRRWLKLAARASASARGRISTSRSLARGRYRAVVEFPGYRSFLPARASRAFTIR